MYLEGELIQNYHDRYMIDIMYEAGENKTAQLMQGGSVVRPSFVGNREGCANHSQ